MDVRVFVEKLQSQYMSNETIYTLTVNLDAKPSFISWYVLDVSASQHKAYDTIQFTFSLPNDHYSIFDIQNSNQNGIHCGKPNCYNITTVNVTSGSQDLFLVGYGNFTCMEQYDLGSTVPRMQRPRSMGCKPSLIKLQHRVKWTVAVLVGIIVCFFLYLIANKVWNRRQARLEETRRREEEELDHAIADKLHSAKTESLYMVLPKTIIEDIQLVTDKESNDNQKSENNVCPICFEDFLPGDEMCSSMNKNCRHKFHTACIVGWLVRDEAKFSCPVCRHLFLIFSKGRTLAL